MESKIKLFLASLLILSSQLLWSQEAQKKEVIQFTGVVFNEDSTAIVPGTHVYFPKSGRGTTTNPYGFFSMPALEGDSVIFSAIGFKRTYYVIPEHKKESSLRVIVTLKEDISFLEEVEIRPYPTESMFKEALITMEMPHEQEYANIHQWLRSNYMREAFYNLPASPNANAQYLINLQQQSYTNRYAPTAIPILNPFAWGQFIRSLRRNN
ncbi:MAG: carboxypeptidase-like regulatory domain-containing protein [Bacteroidota bacterium]